MSITSIEDRSDNERQEFYIHIKELNSLVNQQKIRDFFHGLSVKEEGILIRHNNAFVAFDKRNDIGEAMNRRNRVLCDSEVQLSVISRNELRHRLFRLTRRKLDFSETDGVSKKPGDKTERARRKKIRPTPIIRGKKRKFDSSLIFCPKESDLPPPEHSNNGETLSWTDGEEFALCKKKKIHPVRLSDGVEMENFSVFHPVKCYELRGMIEAV